MSLNLLESHWNLFEFLIQRIMNSLLRTWERCDFGFFLFFWDFWEGRDFEKKEIWGDFLGSLIFWSYECVCMCECVCMFQVVDWVLVFKMIDSHEEVEWVDGCCCWWFLRVSKILIGVWIVWSFVVFERAMFWLRCAAWKFRAASQVCRFFLLGMRVWTANWFCSCVDNVSMRCPKPDERFCDDSYLDPWAGLNETLR